MPYATLDALEDRYGQQMLIRLSDRGDPPAGVIDADTVAQAQRDADALIDGYVAVKYALPIASVPPLIETLALHVTIYNLHVYEPDPKIKADYEAALKSLAAISSGAIRLQVAGVQTAQTGGSGVRVTDRERPMTPDKMKGFI